MDDSTFIRQLDEHLILRHAAPADAAALSDFNSLIHSDEPGERDLGVGAWTHDLLSRPHPTLRPGDFTIVEDTASRQIVSSLCLIPQTWTFAGIPFKVGRPELVGTLAEYRGRGLVRAQMETVHAWSASRGDLVQAITGIPYYYRLFGYEMALNLDGGRAGFIPHVPELEAGKDEPYRLRPALPADVPFLMQVYTAGCRRSLVSCQRDEALWLYELTSRSSESVMNLAFHIIESIAGEALGFIAHQRKRWGAMLTCNLYELKPGISWAAVTPCVLRYLDKAGRAAPAWHGSKPYGAFGFWLGESHPVYEVIPNRLPRKREPYAWYIRVPDLPAFVRHIMPALEQRLTTSLIPNYSGELRLTFYRDGLRLGFEQGKLVKAEKYRPAPTGGSGEAGFPNLTFLHLLFGHRSLDELQYAFDDCWVDTDEAALVLNTLFPRQPSEVWPVS